MSITWPLVLYFLAPTSRRLYSPAITPSKCNLPSASVVASNFWPVALFVSSNVASLITTFLASSVGNQSPDDFCVLIKWSSKSLFKNEASSYDHSDTNSALSFLTTKSLAVESSL